MNDKSEIKKTVNIEKITNSKGFIIGDHGQIIINQPPETTTTPALSEEEAQARLEEMPTDALPTVKSLPTGSRMPFAPYRHFVG